MVAVGVAALLAASFLADPAYVAPAAGVSTASRAAMRRRSRRTLAIWSLPGIRTTSPAG
jgi:hypothetical protein